jgi:hypothetical protein
MSPHELTRTATLQVIKMYSVQIAIRVQTNSLAFQRRCIFEGARKKGVYHFPPLYNHTRQRRWDSGYGRKKGTATELPR